MKDPVVAASQLAIPLVLRKTLLRRTDVVTRLLVMLLATKLSGLINMKRAGRWLFKLEHLIRRRASSPKADRA